MLSNNLTSVAVMRVSYCKRDSRLNPKITGTLWACFLSSVVSGSPLYPAVFRLGLSLMSLLEEQLLHRSFTAQLCSSCSCQLIAFSWKLKNIDHKYNTRASEKRPGVDKTTVASCITVSRCLTHGGKSEVVRLCLTLLSSCSKKARARFRRLCFPPVVLLHQKKITSPINSQLKLNSK